MSEIQRECSTCGLTIERNDHATRVFKPGVNPNPIVCAGCAKRGGVDVSAFCRPLYEVLE
jgi:hypothetical protein